MLDKPLMPKATAVWLLENTSLTFKQIADFCQLHELEIKGIADGDVAVGIKAYNPILANQLTREEIEEGLRKQGGVDQIYGKPLNPKDAAGGHIVPHCDGGTTTMDNLCVITIKDNQRMGSMDAHLYKAMVLSQLEKV